MGFGESLEEELAWRRRNERRRLGLPEHTPEEAKALQGPLAKLPFWADYHEEKK